MKERRSTLVGAALARMRGFADDAALARNRGGRGVRCAGRIDLLATLAALRANYRMAKGIIKAVLGNVVKILDRRRSRGEIRKS